MEEGSTLTLSLRSQKKENLNNFFNKKIIVFIVVITPFGILLKLKEGKNVKVSLLC